MGERTPVRQWVLAIAGILMIAAAIAIVMRNRAQLRPAAAAAAVPTPSRGAALSIQHDGPALRLRWDPRAPDVLAAGRGVLVITDGGRESRMELNPRELAAGLASYWPDSRNVAFRLEVDKSAPAAVQSSLLTEERPSLDRSPAAAVQASPVAEKRPSPFVSPKSPRRRPVPVRRIEPEPDPGPVEFEKPVKRPSRIGRAFGKIPLLRRLRKDRD